MRAVWYGMVRLMKWFPSIWTMGLAQLRRVSGTPLRASPGGEVAQLHAVRVRGEGDEIRQQFDIRRPIAIEMEDQVLKSGYFLIPEHDVFNDEGVQLFASLDLDPEWRGRRRPSGRYKSTVWIPGNLLNEGMHVPFLRTRQRRQRRS